MAKKLKIPNFNPSQLEVVRFKEGPLLVVAVAGAGKTTTLTWRIKNLINSGVDPKSILATTFTKKAATEMNIKLKQIGVDTSQMQVSTFHSVCYKILRKEISNFSRKKLDSTGTLEKNTLKELLGYKYMNWADVDISEVQRKISNWKNALIRPYNAEDFDIRYVEAYRMFEEMRISKGFITFDDMLIDCWELFMTHRDVLMKYQAKFQYVLVDECQDNNQAQHELTKLFAAPQNNVMIVGDDDQSIYAFRGAAPKFLSDFMYQYNAKVIRMEDNYRCAKPIIDAANSLIKYNDERIKKTLRCNVNAESNIEVNCVNDSEEEATLVKDKILELIQDGAKFSDIAVLYRLNAQSRAIEDKMILEGIPYELVGGINFYQRKEIKDMLAYIKGALGYDDADEQLRRVINIPFRYLGKAFLESVDKFMEVNKCSFEAALRDMPAANHQSRSILEFLEIIDYIRANVEDGPSKLIEYVINKTNYIEFLKREEGEDEEENSRIMNVRELTWAASKFNSIKEFLDYIKKMTMKKSKDKDRKDKVTLSTIHRSKGLEWDNVFIIGVNDGILPMYKNFHLDADGVVKCEEERRLMYVGSTRAKRRLYISFSKICMDRALPVSRFIGEMNLTDKVNALITSREDDSHNGEWSFS